MLSTSTELFHSHIEVLDAPTPRRLRRALQAAAAAVGFCPDCAQQVIQAAGQHPLLSENGEFEYTSHHAAVVRVRSGLVAGTRQLEVASWLTEPRARLYRGLVTPPAEGPPRHAALS